MKSLVAVAILVIAACGGDDGEPGATIEVPDAAADGESGTDGSDSPADTLGGTDASEAPDATPATDSATDASDPDATESAPDTHTGPDPAEVAELCAAYCAKLTECGQPFGGTEQCPEQCAVKVGEDPAWANSYACAVIADCQQIQGCTASTIPTDETCTEVCQAAGACGLFPSAQLSQNAEVCELSCSIQMKFNPVGYGQFLECAGAVVADTCSDADVLACNPTLSDQVCSLVCAGGGDGQGGACNTLPAPYNTPEECQSDCFGWTTGQQWTARWCVQQFACGDAGTAVCFPPATEPAAGSEDFCEASWSLCGGQQGYQTPKDPTVCGWILTGFHTANPFEFDGAVACLAGLTACPETPNLIFGCLSPNYEPCTDYCDKLLACGAPSSAEECQLQCNAGAANDKALIDKVIECVLSSPCNQLGPCFEGLGGGG